MERTTNFEVWLATTKATGSSFTASNNLRFEISTDKSEVKIFKDEKEIRSISFKSDDDIYPQIELSFENKKELPYLVEEFEDYDSEEVVQAVNEFVTHWLPDNKLTVSWNSEIIDVIDEIKVPTAGIFVIPNHAGYAHNYILLNTPELEAQMKEFCELNKFTYDPEKDHLVQIWMSSETDGFRYDNLQDHHPSVLDNDGNEYELVFPAHLPECIAKTFREGEPVDLVVPVKVRKWITSPAYKRDGEYNRHNLTAKVKIRLWPDQTITRYRRFGKFEDVVPQVCT